MKKYFAKETYLLNRILFFFLITLLLLSQHAKSQNGNWVWINGDSTPNASAFLGIKGTYGVNNVPEAHYEGCFWKDLQGDLWIYGGQISGGPDGLSDLWKYSFTLNQWMWVKGPGGVLNQNPVYGIKGIPSPLNTPGSRIWTAATWTDNQNNLWLCGGYNTGDKNDMWRYNISTNEWTWMSGTSVPDDLGYYGIKHVPGINNILAARHEIASTFVDTSNNFWVFGGYRATYNNYNDLWKFNPSSNEWSWEAGSSIYNAASNYGQKNVMAATNDPGGRYVQSAWSDCGDNLILFGGVKWGAFPQYLNDIWSYNITNQMWTWVSGSSQNNNTGHYNGFCDTINQNNPSFRTEARTQAIDVCGNAFIFGGFNDINNNDVYGDLWTYNIYSQQWLWLSGQSGVNNTGNFGTKGIVATTNQPPDRAAAYTFTDSIGNVYLFGGFRSNNQYYQDMWKYIPDQSCLPFCQSCGSPPIVSFYSSDTILCEKSAIDFFDISTNNPTQWQWSFPGASPSSSTIQNPTGIYYPTYGTYPVALVATNANGSDSLTITQYITVVANPPAPSVTVNGSFMCCNSVAVWYQWYYNNVAIPNANAMCYNAMQPGNYYMLIMDSNGCNSGSGQIVIASLNETNIGPNFSVWYDATSGNVNVVINKINNAKATITIYDVLGQTIKQIEEENSENNKIMIIPAQFIAKGIYMIEVATKQKTSSGKLLIH